MKKGFLVAIILIAVLTCAFALVACGEVSTTVTYMVDGEVFKNIVVTGTGQSDPGFTPSKSGYTFDGWYTDTALRTPFDFEAYAANEERTDIAVYAKWEVNTYNITYENTKGAANGNPATYNIESATITLADITAPGYTFEGWFVGEEKVESIELGSYGDITLTAKWAPIAYNITYENTKGAANSNPATYNIETAITLSELTSLGYTFEGWFAGEEKVESIELGSYGDVTLTAKWTPIAYNITYENTLGAVNTNPATYNIESAITLSDITSLGYTFEGWYTDETFEEQVNFISEGSFGDLELFAKWTPTEYSVNYVLDGGINNSANPSYYSVVTLGGADGVIALEDPSKDKSDDIDISNGEASLTHTTYTFGGWYKDSGFRQRISELSLSLGNVTLYAKWTESSETTTEQVYTRSGNYIYFGEYPQTIKASNVSITSNTPDADGYYLGSDGERYAKVVAGSSGYKFSDNSSIIDGNTYYFKVEPIRWRILSESNGNAFILCDSIIANRDYHHTILSTTIDGQTVYANNYKYSDIRAWLNDEFYNTAFGDLQQALIQTTEVDNSVYSTGNSSNSYACENTFDKVFLLSYREVTNSAYGFESSSTYDTARQMLTSDFSRATGVYMSTDSSYYGNGWWWWLRSPYYYDSGYARFVNYYGIAGDSSLTVGSDLSGVVPALNLTLS